jgi:transcriptional coactivator HFI1/ADA1
VLAPLLTTTPNPTLALLPSVTSTLHLHNTLLASIYANTLRDPPASEVAQWVVATDKPTTQSKNAGASGAGDKAEERLKKEVMAIHPRDRRRIKTLKEGAKGTNEGLRDLQDYRHELAVKPPDVTAPQSAGGLQRTNWDIEIRRRYAQTLAEETLEFPTQSDVQNRIEPICYEEGLVGGCQQGSLQQCAEMLELATEVYLKEVLGAMYAHTRSNGEGCIQTEKFRQQLRREEEDAERGILQRNAAGFLPVELEAQAKREALSMQDLNLALLLGDGYLRQDRFLAQKIALNQYPQMSQDPPMVNGAFAKLASNGTVGGEDAMVVDGEEPTWKGVSKADALHLTSVLDECLTIG